MSVDTRQLRRLADWLLATTGGNREKAIGEDLKMLIAAAARLDTLEAELHERKSVLIRKEAELADWRAGKRTSCIVEGCTCYAWFPRCKRHQDEVDATRSPWRCVAEDPPAVGAKVIGRWRDRRFRNDDYTIDESWEEFMSQVFDLWQPFTPPTEGE